MTAWKNYEGPALVLLWGVAFIGARLAMEPAGLHPLIKVGAIGLAGAAFALFLWRAMLGLRCGDELERRIQGDALATGFGLSFLLISTLGLVQVAGWADPKDWGFAHVLPIMFLFYAFGLLRARRRYQCEPE